MIYKLSVKNLNVPDPRDPTHIKVDAAWGCADVGERDELQGQVTSSSAHCDLPSPMSLITPAINPCEPHHHKLVIFFKPNFLKKKFCSR